MNSTTVILGALGILALAAPACGGDFATSNGGSTSGSSSQSSSSGAGGAQSSSSGTGGAQSSSSGTGGAQSSSSGTGGAQSGSSSASSTSTSSSTSTTSSSTSGGTTCQWSANTNPCGAGSYCDAPTCGAGTCAPVGTTESQTRTPVCGCDGVTYWNTSVAASHGMPVAAAGACSPGKTCGGIATLKCPTGTLCNYHVSSKSMCAIADLGGTCWGLPQTCPTVLIGPLTRACNAATCTEECALIKQGASWYDDNTCPQ